MKKNIFEKFSKFSTSKEFNSKIQGGSWMLDIASYPTTGGGGYFFGYGTSTNDFMPPSGGCVYVFADGRAISGDCP